jgi:hypothetical protein
MRMLSVESATALEGTLEFETFSALWAMASGLLATGGGAPLAPTVAGGLV